MGIKRDIFEGIELWRQRPLRNTALLLGGAVMLALGMSADAKWGPDHTNETPVTISADPTAEAN